MSRVYENVSKNFTAFKLDKCSWHDFEELFGERGACGGCWCMSWRLKKSDFERQKGLKNKLAMYELVKSEEIIGVVGYVDGVPMGWCAVAPREKYVRLKYSRVLKPIDERPVWSIVCIFLQKDYRRQGWSSEMINAAVEYCRLNGGKIVEAYPAKPYNEKVPAAFLWTGVPSSYYSSGFRVVAQRSEWKGIMRKEF